MKLSVGIFVLLFVSLVSGQELSREQKLQKINDLNSQIRILEESVLQPDELDLKQAQNEGFNVFRLFPREKYEQKLTIEGGGSFYSFTTQSHDYQKIAQIVLEQNKLKVGFAGADYGFIGELYDKPLANIDKDVPEVNFLVNYKPPTNEAEARVEKLKALNYEVNCISYKGYAPVIVGNSYVLRAISFGRADVLVAFKIHRKDTDGSLIIFWKLVEQFEKPILTRSTDISVNDGNSNAALQEKILKALRAKGFYNVTVDTSTKPVTLNGTVPKGKLAEAVQTAQETLGKPVRNQITEQ